MKKLLPMILIMLSFSTTFVQSETISSVPQLINYQGMLTDAESQPLETKEYKLSFSIFNQPTGGTAVWGPQIFDGKFEPGHGAKVPVVRGHFNVILGQKDINERTITDAFKTKDAYLEITIENNSPILPRQQILSTPFALQSEKANTVRDGAITNDKIADHSITNNKIADHSVGVEKLNFSDESGNVAYSGNVSYSANISVKKEIAIGEEPNNKTIISGDKIGVGVNNPSKNLEVNGTIGFTGGKGPFCIFSTECPDGWIDKGKGGFFTKKKDYCPYEYGIISTEYYVLGCFSRICCNE